VDGVDAFDAYKREYFELKVALFGLKMAFT